MINSVILSIAITLVFIFLLLAVMVTAFNELVSTFMRARASQLEGFLGKLFADQKWDVIFQKIKGSPFINVLKKDPKKFPSSIPAENFTSALLTHIGNGSMDLEEIKKAVKANKEEDNELYVMLKAILSQDPSYEQFRAEIDKLFNNAMERLTGWYKRRAKIWSFWVGLGICVLLNVDTITITNNLWKNKDKADQIASFATAAGKYFEKNDSSQIILTSGMDTLAYIKAENKALTHSKIGEAISKTDTTGNKIPQQQLVRSYSVLANLDLPIGWTKENMPGETDNNWKCIGLWLLKILGIMLSTLAVSLGAPYWFDILNKISPLKQGGKSGGSGGAAVAEVK